MKPYEEISVVITLIEQEDIVTYSPGIDFGVGDDGEDLGWGV